MKVTGSFARTLIAAAAVALALSGPAFAGTFTPEIDPGMATGGLTILGIGIVLLAGALSPQLIGALFFQVSIGL